MKYSQKVAKYSCLAALVLAAALRLDGIASIPLQFVVCCGAAFVMVQAARNRKYLWAAVLALIALYFNPGVPIALSRVASLPIALACLLVFLGSARYLTDLLSRGESL